MTKISVYGTFLANPKRKPKGPPASTQSSKSSNGKGIAKAVATKNNKAHVDGGEKAKPKGKSNGAALIFYAYLLFFWRFQLIHSSLYISP